MNASNLDELKRQAAIKSVDFVRDGMVVGLGTGSTAKHVIIELGERVKQGLKIKGVPTSWETAVLAHKHDVELIETEDEWSIDVTIDGADQVDPQFNLIKGGGGALLKEKVVAAAARQLIIVVDHTKCVPRLGKTFPLPIEVVPFGWGSTARQIEELGYTVTLRKRDGHIYKTEAGHYILDMQIERIDNPAELDVQLNAVPGVVETGLFVGRTDVLIVGAPGGVEVKYAEPRRG
ncbi:MAG: ribose 5-phosphate isomerase A [Nitrospirae bacterium RIFCSPLOWO2_02_FULL_62_14]|nr:MAG: ribose 5-phosphate isomerase A [Nitrospirae bacterium RIFCSPLOWO2_01_FULL_62_17]OGW66856.1 MAG: ribose 5-phosphate isomerase A [Nitrospirae bacterium RIFCSPLOWO2_02_FULL_62_14]OGW87958.1 MAG: ribose 5-phosphate isomerase A [Nitrospirae bacterium RIFCSPLOWO2_12_FULL_63_8]